MARILNFSPAPINLLGHIIPAGQGETAFDGFKCTAPGVLQTSNDFAASDFPRAFAGLIAAGLLAAEWDPEPEAIPTELLPPSADAPVQVIEEASVVASTPVESPVVADVPTEEPIPDTPKKK